ncbi:ABC transporter permease [Ignavibacterium sp.]|uniref:ABC transporter permease n=1 Tax=Ignavibacterium sp. TaxID=2651167 RepID=UPI00220F58CB|nr:ABC transporter permease [Ignavibacterium sp.]BDQ03857.1 MAG: peptide ABC transporter permease [Ignavibacterium sp.]
MKKFNKIKLWHFVLFVWIILLIFRVDLLIQTVELFWLTVILIFKNFEFLSSHISFQLIDSLFALAVMFIIPSLLLSSKFRNKFLGAEINFSRCFIILLVYSFFVPTLITREHPDYQKNISEIKLLSPLSNIYQIELSTKDSPTSDSIEEKFLLVKEKVLLKEFDENKIFVRSYSLKQNSYRFNSGGGSTDLSVDKVKSIKSELVLLGTDEFGRDIFSRLIFGERISIFIGMMAVIISLLLGLVLGYIASTGNAIINTVLNRLTDLFLSFPSIFLVILVLALFGNNLLSVIVVLGFSGWMSLYKIVSSEVASVKQKDFFITAQKIGLSNSELLAKEIIPVIIIPVTVNLVFQFSNVILAESSLSFLGLGAGSEYPSWGAMIEKGQEYISEAWWMIFIPGIVLVLTLLSFHNIAKEVNKFFNPKIS